MCGGFRVQVFAVAHHYSYPKPSVLYREAGSKREPSALVDEIKAQSLNDQTYPSPD